MFQDCVLLEVSLLPESREFRGCIWLLCALVLGVLSVLSVWSVWSVLSVECPSKGPECISQVRFAVLRRLTRQGLPAFPRQVRQVPPSSALQWGSCTSLIRNRAPLGPYRRTMHRVLWWS